MFNGYDGNKAIFIWTNTSKNTRATRPLTSSCYALFICLFRHTEMYINFIHNRLNRCNGQFVKFEHDGVEAAWYGSEAEISAHFILPTFQLQMVGIPTVYHGISAASLILHVRWRGITRQWQRPQYNPYHFNLWASNLIDRKKSDSAVQCSTEAANQPTISYRMIVGT